MKLMCRVEISNRLSENNNKSRFQKSCLSIGRLSSKDNEFYAILQTLQNKIGVRYKLTNNIEIVFTKCIEEGKMTIRLKEPAHDIFIQADVVLLKSFARVLHLTYTKKLEAPILNLGELNSKNVNEALRTKVIIKSAAGYPILQGFPRKTVELHIAGLERRSFDRNILKLQNLRILNLSNNQISSLPKDLGMLPNLQELHAAQNLLHKCPKSKWAWMEQLNISKSLKLLDLSSNELIEVPDTVCKLGALVTLKMTSNLLESLPQSLGYLDNLKILDVSKNQIKILPGSIRNQKFSTLNVSFNNFNTIKNYVELQKSFPRLLEIAAKAVYNRRIRFDASIIPSTLVSFMNKAEFCVCGSPCFNNYIRNSMEVSPSRFEGSIVTSGYAMLPFDCYFCSFRCYRRYCG